MQTLKRGDTVKVRGFSGVACTVYGPQTEPGETETTCYECSGTSGPDDDCLCSGTGILYDEEPEPVETGMIYVVMVGDDYRHAVDPLDCEVIDEDAYCHGCGQMGCTHDGRDRE